MLQYAPNTLLKIIMCRGLKSVILMFCYALHRIATKTDDFTEKFQRLCMLLFCFSIFIRLSICIIANFHQHWMTHIEIRLMSWSWLNRIISFTILLAKLNIYIHYTYTTIFIYVLCGYIWCLFFLLCTTCSFCMYMPNGWMAWESAGGAQSTISN